MALLADSSTTNTVKVRVLFFKVYQEGQKSYSTPWRIGDEQVVPLTDRSFFKLGQENSQRANYDLGGDVINYTIGYKS